MHCKIGKLQILIFLTNDSKTEYFTKTISTIGKPTENIDTKVIKNLCKETYIKDNID